MAGQEVLVYLVRVKAGKIQVEIKRLEIFEFQRDLFSVKIRPGGRAIHEEAKCFNFLCAPLVAEDYGDFLDAGFLCCLEAEVPVDDLARAERENRYFETIFVDGCHHLFDRMIILAEIAAVRREPAKWPKLCLHCKLLSLSQASKDTRERDLQRETA